MPQVAALCTLRDLAEEEGATAAHMQATLDALISCPLHEAVQRAAAARSRSDGPPPIPLPACTALLLLGEALVSRQDLSRALPHSWPLLHRSLDSPVLWKEIELAWEQMRLMARASGDEDDRCLYEGGCCALQQASRQQSA